jgi:hypothetical protein
MPSINADNFDFNDILYTVKCMTYEQVNFLLMSLSHELIERHKIYVDSAHPPDTALCLL